MVLCPNPKCQYEHNHTNNARCQRCKTPLPRKENA